MSDEFVRVVLPEDSVVEFSVTVVSYFNAEGEMAFHIQTSADVHATSLLGLLELAKFRIMDQRD